MSPVTRYSFKNVITYFQIKLERDQHVLKCSVCSQEGKKEFQAAGLC